MNFSDESLIKKYQQYLSTILQSLEIVEDEEGELDLRIVNRIAKTASTTIRKCNSYIEDDQLPEKDKKYWESLKLIGFDLISQLTFVMTGILSEAKMNGNMWSLLYSFEVCMDILNLLYNEKMGEDSNKVIIGSLTPEQMEIIMNSTK